MLKKLKKGFLKKKSFEKKAVKEAAEKPQEEVGKEAPEKPQEEVAKGDGQLKGKLVRVVDEASAYCGRVVEVLGHAKGKLHGQVAWKDVHTNFLENTKVPSKLAIDEKAVLPLEEIKKPDLATWKSLRFKDEERAEAEILFMPEELEKGYKLAKDASLPLVHMEMWLWLMARDFELKKSRGSSCLVLKGCLIFAHRCSYRMQLRDLWNKLALWEQN